MLILLWDLKHYVDGGRVTDVSEVQAGPIFKEDVTHPTPTLKTKAACSSETSATLPYLHGVKMQLN
jgi:hypothetical protein